MTQSSIEDIYNIKKFKRQIHTKLQKNIFIAIYAICLNSLNFQALVIIIHLILYWGSIQIYHQMRFRSHEAFQKATFEKDALF